MHQNDAPVASVLQDGFASIDRVMKNRIQWEVRVSLRTFFAGLVLALPWAGVFAHEGDHSGMTDSAIQLHHLAFALSVTVTVVAVIIFAYCNRAARRDSSNGTSRR